MSSAIRPPAVDPSRIRGVVFDLDGTLIDSYAAIASSLNHARQAFGLPAMSESEVRSRVGRGLESLMREVLGAERAAVGVRLFRDHYSRTYREGTWPIAGARETLVALRERGFRLSVASNKPASLARAILGELALGHLLVAVEGPETAGAPKPDPRMIERCLEAMSISRDAACYVGDMVLDVESAARAGVSVLLVPGGSSEAKALVATGERVLPSLADLSSLLPPSAPAPL